MRRLLLIIVVLLLAGLAVGFYPHWVEKPASDGPGPLAVHMDPGLSAPEYHSPLPWWQTHHMDVLSQGDITQVDCLFCHDPEQSCNNCHAYVGVRAIGK
jgi:hypothetical protein